ncbi:hypothetical protein [Bdellovibrio sp. HCB209]|uniref:hypothetical protein n=1 Tax=Bdellovibrio sp. HCB209 TaxID=3394354 RepID=UPI0039B5C0B0
MKTDLVGIKEIFPIVIKGKVVERIQMKNRDDSFLLKIQILEVVKGDLVEKYIAAEELHPGASGLGKHIYQVGDEYYFPMSQKPGEKIKSVYLPADGCPALPKKTE